MAWTDPLAAFAPSALVGVGIVLAAPVIYPAVRGVLRPATKGAIKGYLTLQDTLTEWAAESGEQFSDLVAEAHSEYATGAATTGATAATQTRKTGKRGGARKKRTSKASKATSSSSDSE